MKIARMTIPSYSGTILIEDIELAVDELEQFEKMIYALIELEKTRQPTPVAVRKAGEEINV